MPDVKLATMLEVRKFFGINPLSQFKAEWEALPANDRHHLRTGIGDGTFDYDPASVAPA